MKKKLCFFSAEDTIIRAITFKHRISGVEKLNEYFEIATVRRNVLGNDCSRNEARKLWFGNLRVRMETIFRNAIMNID